MGCGSSKGQSTTGTPADQQCGPGSKSQTGAAVNPSSGDAVGWAQEAAKESAHTETPDAGASSSDPTPSKSSSSRPVPDKPVNGTSGDNSEASTAKRLRRLLKLCKEVRVLEAVDLLEGLEKDLNDLNGLSSMSSSARSELQQRLQSDPVIRKLRTCSALLRTNMGHTLEPASRDDAKWASLTVQDPRIGEDFYLDIGLRCAEDSEFDKNGPSLQIIAKGNAYNFPIPFTKYMAMQREVDLAEKEWIKDCDSIAGFVNSSQPFASLVHLVLSPALLPFRLQEMVIRSFCICPEAPASINDGAGILILESNPPDGATEYDGWEIPKGRKRTVTLTGSTKMFYAVPGKSGQINVRGAVRLGIPVPRWMVPLDLIKRFVADIFRESLRKVKEEVVDRWSNYPFDERIFASADFYKQAKCIEDSGAAQDSDDEQVEQPETETIEI